FRSFISLGYRGKRCAHRSPEFGKFYPPQRSSFKQRNGLPQRTTFGDKNRKRNTNRCQNRPAFLYELGRPRGGTRQGDRSGGCVFELYQCSRSRLSGGLQRSTQ